MNDAPIQLPLDLPHRAAYEHEDFLVAPSNWQAVSWIDQWPDWPCHCVIIYGAAGCGKTHLSHVWEKAAEASRLTLQDINLADFPEQATAVIVENVEDLMGEAGFQEKLFHLYNWQKEKGGFLLLSAKRPPKLWGMTLPDLSSRMLASTAIEIGVPDDALLSAIMVKQFSDRQINISKDVIAFLLPRMERSFAAVRAMVRAIDSLALSEKRKITVPLVRQLLEKTVKNL